MGACSTCGYNVKLCRYRHTKIAAFGAALRNGYVALQYELPRDALRLSFLWSFLEPGDDVCVNPEGEPTDRAAPGSSIAVAVERLEDLAALGESKEEDVVLHVEHRRAIQTVLSMHALVRQGMPLALAQAQAARPHTIKAARALCDARGVLYCTTSVGSDCYGRLGVLSPDGTAIRTFTTPRFYALGQLRGRRSYGWELRGVPDATLSAEPLPAEEEGTVYVLSKNGTQYLSEKQELRIGVAESYWDPSF